MFWWILFGASMATVIVGIIGYNIFKESEWPASTIGIGIAICLAALGLLLVGPISAKKSIYSFEKQKEYIEAHVSGNAIEDAAITSKKTELNEWLYNAQYGAVNYRIFVFCPDEKLALEPIE